MYIYRYIDVYMSVYCVCMFLYMFVRTLATVKCGISFEKDWNKHKGAHFHR